MKSSLRTLEPRLEVTLNFLGKSGQLLRTNVVNGVELTPDQQQHLHNIAIESIDIAETWKAIATGSPLPWNITNNNIYYKNKTYREMLERRVEELIKLRALICYASPDIVGCCHYALNNDVKNEIDLLNILLWTGIVNRFNICREKYNEISNNKITKKIAADIKLVSHLVENPQAPLASDFKIPDVPHNARNPYIRFIGDYYRHLIGAGDKKALQLFQDYANTALDNNQYALRKRRRKLKPEEVKTTNFIPYRCHSWQKGIKFFAGSGGIYPPINSDRSEFVG